jgi:YidC/Oxa1 family membrane protein insertase
VSRAATRSAATASTPCPNPENKGPPVLAASPLDPLYYAIGWLLSLFYVPFKSLGVAIILLTIIVMLVQLPLIAKQTRSMIQMQRVQPEIKRIQQKYKDDRQRQNEELLKFYQENKINPLAGCLPMLVTLPIGLAVFRTFNEGVQKHLPTSGPLSGLYDDLCGGRSVSACTTYLNQQNDKGHIPKTLRFLTMNLDWSAHEIQSQRPGQYLQWLPYFLIIAAVIFTGWYQVRQTQARQLRQGSQAPNAQMQASPRIMPIFFGVITYGLNAATTIYFVVSNTWRVGQQHFVLSKMYDEEHRKEKPQSKIDDDVIDIPPDDAPSDANGRKGPAKPKPIAGASGGSQDGPAPRDGNGAGPSSGARRKQRKKKR